MTYAAEIVLGTVVVVALVIAASVLLGRFVAWWDERREGGRS